MSLSLNYCPSSFHWLMSYGSGCRQIIIMACGASRVLPLSPRVVFFAEAGEIAAAKSISRRFSDILNLEMTIISIGGI
jgi:hypothetical protein